MAPLVFRVTAVMLLATLMSTTTAKPSSSLAGLIRDLTSMRSSMASGEHFQYLYCTGFMNELLALQAP